MTKMESSADLINNLLLNLDNLQLQAENKTPNGNIEDLNNSLQDQLELLKSETEKLKNQYTQTSTKTKTKKIPPPIITGKYKKHSQFQTIDDMLYELNNATYQTYGGNKTPVLNKSGKGKKITGSFVDPRRYSDPYKYTILSTLDETEDGEEEEDTINNNTPKTALPFYGRKKDYRNLTCNTSNNLKLPVNQYISPQSAGSIRTRSLSQPEHYTNSKHSVKSSLHESSSMNYNMKKSKKTSMEYLKKIEENINQEKKNKLSDTFIKPPRSSSINKHGNSFGKQTSISIEKSESITEPVNLQNNTEEMTITKNKSFSGLENKSSFQSDITLVNEE